MAIKHKVNPRWEGRFQAYRAAVPLATVIAALVHAHQSRARVRKDRGS